MEIMDCSNWEYVWYRVQKQDTLLSIANKFNVEINSIIRNCNNVDLYDGEIVKVQKNVKHTHIVKPMETLESIAKKYGVDTKNLIQANNLSSTRLFVGQILTISNS